MSCCPEFVTQDISNIQIICIGFMKKKAIMSTGGYKIIVQGAMYFVSFVPICHDSYRESNHLHLIISSKGNNVSDVPGDFKEFTSKKLLKSILEHPGESRKECLPECSHPYLPITLIISVT